MYSSTDSETCFTKMPIEKLTQAIEITERFDIKQVYQRCISSLQRRKIDPINVMQFLDFGLKKNFESIVQKSVKVLNLQGIRLKALSDNISLVTILALLTIEKIALKSEASLLELVISWLSYPSNKDYKSEVLSFVDLLSIEWNEFQRIWKTYPSFFSEVELSSILFAVAQQDVSLFPKWYKPKIASTVESSCDICTMEHRRLNVPKCCFLKWNHERNLKAVAQGFYFNFENARQARLVNIVLNFGPSNIREKDFILKCSKNGISQWQECFLKITKRCSKYIACFDEPLILKTNNAFTLKFHFEKGLVSSNIQLLMPNIIERQKINEAWKTDGIGVELNSSKLAFFCNPEEKDAKFLVSSFCFNFCDKHTAYLVRKRMVTEPEATVIQMKPEFMDIVPKEELVEINMIKKENTWDE